jgi:hypothetical protein
MEPPEDEEGIVVGNTFFAWASLYPSVIKKKETLYAYRKRFKVYYQYNAPDCDPEYIANFDTLEEAWKLVYDHALQAHKEFPDLEIHPDLYQKLPNRKSMTSDMKAAFFDMPKELEEREERLICISNYDMYFVTLLNLELEFI